MQDISCDFSSPVTCTALSCIDGLTHTESRNIATVTNAVLTTMLFLSERSSHAHHLQLCQFYQANGNSQHDYFNLQEKGTVSTGSFLHKCGASAALWKIERHNFYFSVEPRARYHDGIKVTRVLLTFRSCFEV